MLSFFFRYEGEWHNNKKHGYGITTFRDGSKEEGKYKCNILITSQKKKHLFLIRSAKFRERIEAAVSSAQRASKYALQKADIAVSRQSTARGKAEMADNIADHAKVDSEVAVATAKEFAPDFKPSVLERFERIRLRERFKPPVDVEQIMKSNSSHLQENRTQLNMDINFGNQNQIFGQQNVRRNSQLLKQSSIIDYSHKNTNHQLESSKTGGVFASYPENQQRQGTYSQYSQHQPSSNNYPTPQANVNKNQSASKQVEHNMDNLYNNNNNHENYSNIRNYDQQQLLQYQKTTQQSNYYDQQQIHQQRQDLQPIIKSDQYNNKSHVPSNISNLRENYNTNEISPSFHLDQSEIDFTQPQNDKLSSSMRKNSKPFLDGNKPNFSQSSIDHFDHYKRPPSRDSSVDRYARATNRMGGNSRQTSVERSTGIVPCATILTETPERTARAGSAFRGASGAAISNGAVITGTAGSRSQTPVFTQSNVQVVYSNSNQPFEDILLRQKSLGQDIIPSPREPKRTESLYLPPKLLLNQGAEKPKLKVSST